MKFYGLDIDFPLSSLHGTTKWNFSKLNTILDLTDGAVYIKEIPVPHRTAKFCWRIVNVEYSIEDSMMSYFKAYDLEGNYIPDAVFGVNWASVKQRISGGFKYYPLHNNEYYVPVNNSFPTPNTGGYDVQVLDLDNPSESLAFGMYKQDHHSCPVISFRLFPMDNMYPNDR